MTQPTIGRGGRPLEAAVPKVRLRDEEGASAADRGSLLQVIAWARVVAASAAARAPELDTDGSSPSADIEHLRETGLIRAPIPTFFGGADLGNEAGSWALCEVLRLLGSGNLSVGRLYEGHVNAIGLIARYGTAGQKRKLFADARRGHLFGVWNTDPRENRLTHEVTDHGLLLHGGKDFASGAGFVTRPLVTSVDRASLSSPSIMLVIPLEQGERANLSKWRALGMRASASGSVDFSGSAAGPSEQIGAPGDYGLQPYFSGGAWRFAAVQAGGVDAVFDAWRAHLRETMRGDDPHQALRLGEGAIAVETARLWAERAASMATDTGADGDQVLAYVGLARSAVERCGLRVMELAQRSVGLQGFLHGHPLERLCRDLSTYLRQPGPDRALAGAASYVLQSTDPGGDMWRRARER